MGRRSALTERLLRWGLGFVAGTLIIAISSPWFVRSYLPLQVDSVRGVWTLPPLTTYRWRSEGYANTAIGPLGMPGRTVLPAPSDPAIQVALWGDSQAEGVCVADREKLFAQIEQAWTQAGPTPDPRPPDPRPPDPRPPDPRALDPRPLAVLPFARSGEDAGLWATQMPRVNSRLGIDAHVVLIADLPDLLGATDAPSPVPAVAERELARNAIAARLPAFIIQAARHLLTEADGTTRRRLRFAVGPETVSPPASSATPHGSTGAADWDAALECLKQAAGDKPVIIVYAPVLPQIVDGEILRHDPTATLFRSMLQAASRSGIKVIDMRPLFTASAESGIWPHGFDNGRIGSGHLNEHGYKLIATSLQSPLLAAASRRSSVSSH